MNTTEIYLVLPLVYKGEDHTVEVYVDVEWEEETTVHGDTDKVIRDITITDAYAGADLSTSDFWEPLNVLPENDAQYLEARIRREAAETFYDGATTNYHPKLGASENYLLALVSFDAQGMAELKDHFYVGNDSIKLARVATWVNNNDTSRCCLIKTAMKPKSHKKWEKLKDNDKLMALMLSYNSIFTKL